MKAITRANDRFWYDGNEFKVVSFDMRINRSNVAIDRGCDADGEERRVEAERLSDGFRRRFSFLEIEHAQRSQDGEAEAAR